MRSSAPPTPRRSGDGPTWAGDRGDDRQVTGGRRWGEMAVASDMTGVHVTARMAADRLDIDGLMRLGSVGHFDAYVTGLVVLTDARQTVGNRLARAVSYLDGALAASPAQVGWWSAVVGWLQLQSGELTVAEGHLEAARLALGRDDPWGIRLLVTADLALAAAASERPAAAGRWLAELADAAGDDVGPRLGVRRGIARALLAELDDGAAAGAELALATGDDAASVGLLGDAIDAWLVAARFGAAERVVIRIDARIGDVTGAATARLELDAAYARALAAGDAGALLAVARRLAQRGRLGDATEAAAAALRRTGDDRTRGLVAGLITARRGVAAPRGLRISRAELSPRQRQVAALAIEGLDDRTIAARLGIGLRTVQNHLAAVYRCLGVSGRRELAAIYRCDHPPLVLGAVGA